MSNEIDFSAVECFVDDKNIWNIPYLSRLSFRYLRTNAGEQYTISLSLFFLSIQITLLYKMYIEVCFGIHKLYTRLGLGWTGNQVEEE